MAIVIKCDICGAENAKNVKVLTYRTFSSRDGKIFRGRPTFQQEELDLCDDCVARATNVHAVGVMCNKYIIEPIKKEGTISSNEGYINIYEADGKEELRTSCKVYKTLDKALKEKEAHCDDEYYLRTIKISW